MAAEAGTAAFEWLHALLWAWVQLLCGAASFSSQAHNFWLCAYFSFIPVGLFHFICSGRLHSRTIMEITSNDRLTVWLLFD
jgi:hypothetical protein